MILISFALLAAFTTQINCAVTQKDDFDIDLPPPCPANAQLNQCLQGYVQSFWDKYANDYGSKTLGIPPLDPFVMGTRKWSFKNQLFDFVVQTDNVKIYNMKETTIRKTKLKYDDSNRFVFEADLTDPEVIAEGEFKVNLKISELKLRHKGHFLTRIRKIHNYAKTTGIMEEKNGDRYFKAERINFKPDFKNIHFEIQRANATESDLAIDNLIMGLFERHAQDLYKEFTAVTRPVWEPILLEVANNFLSNFPAKLAITF